jgi:hypothetical protein
MTNLQQLLIAGKQNQATHLGNTVRPLANSTINVYYHNLNLLHRISKTELPVTNPEWIKENFDVIIDYITTSYNVPTRKNLYSALLALLYTDYENYSTRIKILVQTTKQNYNNIEVDNKININENILEKVIPKQEYFNFILKLKDLPEYKREYVLLLLINQLYCRNEIATLILTNKSTYSRLDSDKQKLSNWVVLSNKNRSVHIIRHVYKTSATHGTLEHEITGAAKTALLSLIKNYDKHINDLVFNFTENQLSQRLAYISDKLIGIKLSTSSIVKILISSFVNNKSNTTEIITEFLKDVSERRGTSFNVLLSSYVYKTSTNDNDDI